AFATYVLGQEFYADRTAVLKSDRMEVLKRTDFEEAMRILGDTVERKPEGYAIDRRYPNIVYVPEYAEFSVREGSIKWRQDGRTQQLTLRVDEDYVLPSGYKVRLEKQFAGTSWRLVGSLGEGTLCHKPCTVSGGGKSEISKSINSVLLKGPVFVRNYNSDM